jgi:hypothetical protein
MQTIIDEFNRHSTRPGAHKEKGINVAFFAGWTSNNQGGKKMNRDVECFNCHKKGHKKQDCWAKEGGKKGQGPRSKDNQSKRGDLKEGGKDGKRKSVNAVEDNEGIWMAVTNDSGDEEMADNEFEDFEVAKDDLFFFENDKTVEDLATCLKKLLNITTPPYYNPHDIFNVKDSTDFSDNNNNGAATMQVVPESESDSKI